jgi:glycolate oxidase FAD binding subunit
MTTSLLPCTETIAPADEAAVVDALRKASRDGVAVYPLGGGTSLDYGTPPSRPGIGLSLKNLCRVIDYPADDMTITAGAGMTIGELGKHLAEKRQRLPVDIRQPELATIGGVVATNLSGPRRYAYGTIRDYLLGFRAVDGQGGAFSGGGRVVKNAAGYNMGRLMVGSLGTLAVVTQVTLMVRPLPEASALVACDAPDFDAAERLLAALVNTQTLPVAVELLAGPGRQQGPVLGPLRDGHAAKLVVGFEGMASEVEWMVRQLQDEWRALGVGTLLSAWAAEAELLWQRLTDFSADLQVSVPPGATVAMVHRLLQLEPGGSVQARAGNGLIYLELKDSATAEHWQNGSATRLRQELRPAVAEAGGRLVVLRCPPGTPLSGCDVWGPPGDGAAVMRAIKDRFDPQNILNPGRFVYENS